jgi:hypothetical protein
LPEAKRLAVVGGPARKSVIKEGPWAGKTYVGGSAESFERLVIPSGRHEARNAWYRLGRPTLLGPQFGETAHWGRIEIEPARHHGQYLFVTVLVTDRAGANQPPQLGVESAEGGGAEVSISLGKDELLLRLPGGIETGGRIEVRGEQPQDWTLPNEVCLDEALAVR